MRTFLKLLAFVPFIASCHGIVRDETVYKNEVGFMGASALDAADAVVKLIALECKCTDGKFTPGSDCEKYARNALVIQSRVPWHASMMLYNARLATDRPAETPPAVPATSTLCPAH